MTMKSKRPAATQAAPPEASKTRMQLCIGTDRYPQENTSFHSGHGWLSLRPQGSDAVSPEETIYDNYPGSTKETDPFATGNGNLRKVPGDQFSYTNKRYYGSDETGEDYYHAAPTEYCTPVDQGQIESLDKIVADNTTPWGLLNQCTTFAADAFNSVTGVGFNAKDPFALGQKTPRAVANEADRLNAKEGGYPPMEPIEPAARAERQRQDWSEALQYARDTW